jgi:hypothetical protein
MSTAERAERLRAARERLAAANRREERERVRVALLAHLAALGLTDRRRAATATERALGVWEATR